MISKAVEVKGVVYAACDRSTVVTQEMVREKSSSGTSVNEHGKQPPAN